MDNHYLLYALLIAQAILPFTAAEPISRGPDYYASLQTIPMRIEVEMMQKDCIVGENTPIRISIHNISNEDVVLANVEFDYQDPAVYLHREGDKPAKLWYGATDVNRVPPLRIPVGGRVEHTRMLYGDFQPDRWPIAPGIEYLFAKHGGSYTQETDTMPQRRIEWEMPKAKIIVRERTAKEKEAWEFLVNAEKKRENARKMGTLPSTDLTLARIEYFREFLQRYSNTPYAKEIRWELAQMLRNELGSSRVPADKVDDAAQAMEACILACLDKGDPYSDPFLDWDSGGGMMHWADRFNRPRLVIRLAEELDKKYPDDEESKLYREVWVAKVKGAKEKAKSKSKELRRLFPESKFNHSVNRMIEVLEADEN